MLYCDRDKQKDYVMVTLEGEFDIEGLPYFKTVADRLLNEGQANLVFDMGGIEYMDSRGIGELVQFSLRASQVGGKVFIANLNPIMKKVFERLHLEEQLNISESRRKAIEAIRDQQQISV